MPSPRAIRRSVVHSVVPRYDATVLQRRPSQRLRNSVVARSRNTLAVSKGRPPWDPRDWQPASDNPRPGAALYVPVYSLPFGTPCFKTRSFLDSREAISAQMVLNPQAPDRAPSAAHRPLNPPRLTNSASAAAPALIQYLLQSACYAALVLPSHKTGAGASSGFCA
jgi:hypothetical protein